MFSRKVYWAVGQTNPTPYNESIKMLFQKPEPLLNHVLATRSKQTNFVRCPAFLAYLKNTFVVKCPFDVEFSIAENGRITPHTPQGWMFNSLLIPSLTEGVDKNPVYQISIPVYCLSKKSVAIQQLPAFMDDSDFIRSTIIVPGEYDISKWVRPLVTGFEVKSGVTKVSLKKGDPMYYIRFVAEDGSKVDLERIELTKDLDDLSTACSHVKLLQENNSLKENYAIAAEAIRKFWRGWRK